MVRLHVKRGDESQFLFDAFVNDSVQKVTQDICALYNGRLKIDRICCEIEELAEHGTTLPQEMQGLTDEQIEELKLKDIWGEKCIPSGGFEFNKDEIGRRNGKRPMQPMQDVLKKAVTDAKDLINKKLVTTNTPLTLKTVEEAMHILKGAVTIVYPMQLPPHDPIRMEFTNTEDLDGTQASKEVIEPSKAVLWFAGHEMLGDKCLKDYVGANDKTKVIVKISSRGQGPPGREPVLSEDARKQLMLQAYRRQEQLKEKIRLAKNILDS
ncbi:unnamed protein product [Hermetia illucens]|uniref:Cilia- and flagella-associated protein 298 n=1 Tax=Hermetia illucens TaxID=343691 RepID=A0A7R8UMQ2_HERIL|nr:unnamed protein product [Hermetia illucens]